MTVLTVEQPTSTLNAGELRFCEGWSLLRSSALEEATEVLYTASVELPESAMVHAFLAIALGGTEDTDLGLYALGEALALEPHWLSYRWDPTAHLGEDGALTLRTKLANDRVANPLLPAPLALEALLALLADDRDRLEDLRGVIAESLLVHPDTPALAELLTEIRRRFKGAPTADTEHTVQSWLLEPSCDRIPELGLSD